MKRYIKSADAVDLGSRKEIAKNSTDPEELAKLSEDSDEIVRMCVAGNIHTPEDILTKLAGDASWNVRESVAFNKECSSKLLTKLSRDRTAEVKDAVARNHNTSLEVLAKLSTSRFYYVREAVAENPNTSEEILMQLADDKNLEVRNAAISRLSNSSKYLDNKNVYWPSSNEWYNVDSDEQFENMWSEYLSDPEDKVNKELQIFTEPSVQGMVGDMYIYDESDSDNESFSVNFSEWCNRELQMAAQSKNAKDYENKYRSFIQGLIDANWM